MESLKPNETEGTKDKSCTESLGHFINYVRVATAIAIIKTKPQGASALQHAKTVCAQFMCNQTAWREKVVTLEDKVLDLEQQLLQNEITVTCNKGDGDSEQVFPTPPSSSDPVVDENQEQAACKPLTKHMDFLTSIIALRNLPNSNSHGPHEKIREMTNRTVKKSLHVIKTWLCDPERHRWLSEKMLGHCVGVIVNVVNGELGQSRQGVIEEVCSVVEGLIVELVQSTQLNNWPWQDKLQQIVFQFGETPALYSNIVTLLIECIQRYAEFLRHTKTKRKLQDPCMFENVHYIFDCLEKLLHKGLKQGFSLSKCGALMSQLEDSLLHISDFLPVFSLYVWQINGLLENFNRIGSIS